MKKLISLLLSMSIVLSLLPSVVLAAGEESTVTPDKWDGEMLDFDWDGDGTAESPYKITSAAELAGLASKTFNAISTSTDVSVAQADGSNMYNAYTGVYFKLMCDIDLNDFEWLPIGRIGMRFNGSFDGGNHIIKNLKISKNYFSTGFFGATGRNVSIKNLGIDGAKVVYDSKGNSDSVYDKITNDGVDSTWNITAGIPDTSRTFASGTLIGAVGGGSIEECFVTNAEVKNTNRNARQPMAGGLIGAAVATKPWQGTRPNGFSGSLVKLNEDIVTNISNTYVTNTKIGGCIARIGAFAGSCDNNASGAAYKAGYIANNCYAAVITAVDIYNNDRFDYFFDRTHVSSEISKCFYGDISASEKSANSAGATQAEKTEIVENMVKIAKWSPDNATTPINDGYPILGWQNTWDAPTQEPTTEPTAIPTAEPTATPKATPQVPQYDVDWEGDGTETSPYLITSKSELMGLADKAFNAISTSTDVPVAKTDLEEIYAAYTDTYFKLMCDIDLENEEWLPIGRAGMRFNGVFDGNNHTVKNLKMTRNYFGMGFFGATGTDFAVKNLGLDGVSMVYKSRGNKDSTYDDGRTASDVIVNASDITWNAPLDVSTSSTSRLNRTYASGALIGMVSGGTVEGCFARNVEIKNTESGANQQNIGAFIGGSMATQEWVNGNGNADTLNKNKKTITTVKNSYVNNVTLGGTARFKSGFIGSASRHDSKYLFRSVVRAKNCYVGKISGENEAFCDSAHSIECTLENSFSMSQNDGATNYMNATLADKSLIIDSMTVGETEYTLDGTYFSKNSGMPILKREAPWLNNTETNLISEKLINKLTDGQSKDHIFYNMNFIKNAEIDGVNYEFDYLSQYEDLISNTGEVTRAKTEKTCDIKVYIHNVDTDEWTTETVTFNVLPRGEGIFKESFDNTAMSGWLPAVGDVSQTASATGYIDDKMLVLANGSITRNMSEQSVGTINAVLSVYNDDTFGSVAVTLGSARVEISKDKIKVGNSEIEIAPETGWFDVTIETDLDNNTLTITSCGVTSEITPFTASAINAVTLDGTAKVDNLLVYESIPGELDALTEAMVLNGQNKFDVTRPLNLPNKVEFHRGEIDIIWESSNEDVVALDGTLGTVELTEKVTLTAKAYDSSKLGEGVTPSESDILQTKQFDVYVVPVGSSLIFVDDFETAEKEGTALAGYNKWSVNSTGKFVKYSIERDPNGNPLDEFIDSNKVMRQSRIIAGSSAADVETPGRTFDSVVDEDMIEFSYDIYTTSLANEPMFRIRDAKGLMTEVYVTSSNGWLSNTTLWESTNNRIAFGFKPGNWQNHKFVLDTVNKTIAVYVDGVYKNTYRYTGVLDTVSGIAFGSSRHSDPIGMTYFDNVMVRKIMPNDRVAVDTVYANLSIDDTAAKNIKLPTTGKFKTDIIWKSSNPDVIAPNGTVIRGGSDETVTLTAKVVKGTVSMEKSFDVAVPASTGGASETQKMLDSIAENFLWSEVSGESQFAVTEDLNLVTSYNKGSAKELGGVSVTWTTSNSSAVKADGTVTRGAGDKYALLTATFAKGDKTAEKTFKVYVPQEGVTNTICESFGDYAAGDDVTAQSDKWTDVTINGGGNARVMYDGVDYNNKTLCVKRKTSVDSLDMKYKYNAKMTSTDMIFSIMVKLNNKFDFMRIDIGGTEQQIVVTQSSVKIGNAEYSKPLTIGEWYNISIYYNTAEGVFDAYLDTEKFTEASLKYDGGNTIDGITISDLSDDRSTPGWMVDEITVRDISIADDTAAIKAALRDVNLDTTEIEWNIENLPTAARYGVSIEWISEKPEVLSSEGIVNREEGKEYTFKFTARGKRNGVTVDKDFTVHVPAIPSGYKPTQEIFDKQMSQIPFSFYTDQKLGEITQDIDLPTEYNEGNSAFYGGANIEWSTNKSDVIDKTGKVTRPFFDESVTLTAVYTSKRDPSIKTTVTYKVTVWAESEILFSEDFENVTADKEGTQVIESDTRFRQEVKPQERAQFLRYRKDIADVAKPWDEANKVIAVERERGNGVYPERLYLDYPDQYSIDKLAISFDYMVEDTSVAGTVGIEESIFQPTIQKSTFWSKAMKVSPIEAKKWYTFTYVLMKSSGFAYVLRDGEPVLSGYLYNLQGQKTSFFYMDIFRNNPPGKFYVDNIIVRNLTTSDEDAVNAAVNALSITEGDVYGDLVLNYTGINRTLIGYTSSDPDVISNEGKVVRPTDADRKVSLTALVSRGGYMKSKTFNFNVKRSDTFATPYTISDITGSVTKKFSSVSVETHTPYAGDAYVIIAAYDKSDTVATRCIPLSALSGGTITFDEIDLSDTEYYSIEAYIVSGSAMLSNKKSIKY